MCGAGRGSTLVQQVMISAIIHAIGGIWMERNNRYYNDRKKSIEFLIHSITSEVHLSFNLVLVKGSTAMADFKLSQMFGIPLKPRRVQIINDVTWSPPPTGWIKLNVDGSSMGAPVTGSIGIVIRNEHATFLGAYAQNIAHASVLEDEPSACMKAFKLAQELHIENLWLETNSLHVVKAFTLGVGVPWRLLTRWNNCLSFASRIRCKFTHVLREGNLVADSLAKNDQQLALFSFQWWYAPPLFVDSLLSRDSIGLSFSKHRPFFF
jgi:ribonuclease HI